LWAGFNIPNEVKEYLNGNLEIFKIPIHNTHMEGIKITKSQPLLTKSGWLLQIPASRWGALCDLRTFFATCFYPLTLKSEFMQIEQLKNQQKQSKGWLWIGSGCSRTHISWPSQPPL